MTVLGVALFLWVILGFCLVVMLAQREFRLAKTVSIVLAIISLVTIILLAPTISIEVGFSIFAITAVIGILIRSNMNDEKAKKREKEKEKRFQRDLPYIDGHGGGF